MFFKLLALSLFFIPTVGFCNPSIPNTIKDNSVSSSDFKKNMTPFSISINGSLQKNGVGNPSFNFNANAPMEPGISEPQNMINAKSPNLSLSNSNFTTNPPTPVDENTVNSANYKACVKILLNTEEDVEFAVKQCRMQNPGYNNQNQVAKMENLGTFDEKYLNSDHTNVDTTKKTIKEDPLYLKNNLFDNNIFPSNIQSDVINGDCDVSRDIRVLFSPKCRNITDDAISIGRGISGKKDFPTNPIISPMIEKSHKNIDENLLCEYAFFIHNQEYSRSKINTTTAIDCLKKAIDSSHGKVGKTIISMTQSNGDSNIAICEKTNKNKLSCSTH